VLFGRAENWISGVSNQQQQQQKNQQKEHKTGRWAKKSIVHIA